MYPVRHVAGLAEAGPNNRPGTGVSDPGYNRRASAPPVSVPLDSASYILPRGS